MTKDYFIILYVFTLFKTSQKFILRLKLTPVTLSWIFVNIFAAM